MKKNWLPSLIFGLILILALSLTACSATVRADTGASRRNDSGGDRRGDTMQTGENTITAEEAESIALEHAGFTADEVTGLHSQYDLDDGVPEYEVEFRADGWEYEYEIHAETGDIRAYDRDD